jgi:hypothetical protein
VLGRFIPTRDNAVGRFADNRIVRRCHDGSKPLLRLGGAPALADIKGHCRALLVMS